RGSVGDRDVAARPRPPTITPGPGQPNGRRGSFTRGAAEDNTNLRNRRAQCESLAWRIGERAMNCDQAKLLLHPYLDGELDVVQSLQVVEHLGQCAACEERRAQVQRLSEVLTQADLRLTAPPALKERVQA